MDQIVRVFVNGQAREVPEGQSVAALLAWLKIDSERVAVELNKSLVRKRDWNQTAIGNDARLEIVEFVGGG